MHKIHINRIKRWLIALTVALMPLTTGYSQTGRIAVSGQVSDVSGAAIPGATVVEKGTNNGTTSDADGKFSLQVSPDATLSVSFVGYASQDIAVENRTTINVTLAEAATDLDEVVVVSYGRQSKRLITGAVQSVNTKELESMPVAQLSQKLQGKLAGVQINQVTGIPGQGMEIRIRGQASISAGSDPLIVVDGFPITGSLADINPDEIDNISVLKDASASSLYGSRAANGVILITTKRAKAGTSQMSVSAYVGVQQIPSNLGPDMMNARQFAQFKKEIAEENNWAVPDYFKNPEQYGEGTDWMDVITRNALIQNYSINYTAAKEKFSTSAVAGFMSQEGVLLNSNYNRFSLRVNSDYKPVEQVKIGFNLSGTYHINNTPESDGTWYDSGGHLLQRALLTSPLAPWKNPDGSIPINAINWGDPYGTLECPNWYNVAMTETHKGSGANAIANAFVEYSPIEGLTLKTSINGELINYVTDAFIPSTSGAFWDPGNESDPSRIKGSHGDSYTYTWLWENTANYNFTLAKDHHFDVLAGWTVQRSHTQSGTINASDFPDNNIRTLNAAKKWTASTDIQDWSLASFVARLNYNYKYKYLLSLAFRTDGSSKFGVNNRWGNFPSASVGWVVSEESFMEPLKPVMSYMKIRASYGVTGNNNVGNYTQYASMANTNTVINNVLQSGKSLDGFQNSMLGWESTSQLDLGVDFGFFDGRISLGYDYYHKNTSDLLYTVDLPISSGFTNFETNIGELEFWGHEFMLSTQNFVGAFKWNTDFNISFNDNRVVALGTNNATLYGDNTINEVGERMGNLFGLIWEGVYMTQAEFDNSPNTHYMGAEVGMVRYKDADESGEVTNDERDKRPIGRTSPKAILGMTNTFAFMNFDLSIVTSGAFGHKMFDYQERFTTNLDGTFNVITEINDRWRSESNPGAGRHGKVISGRTAQERDWFSSNFVYAADYFTIKNITLGYTIPLKSKAIRNFRIYGSIQQALVLTKYPGNNPEATASGGVSAGIDYTRYPVPRTYTFGLNMNF